MASSRRRGPKKPVSPRAGAWLDRVGGAALVRLWSLLVRALALIGLAVEWLLHAAWRWLRWQRPWVKLAALAGAGLAIVFLVRRLSAIELPLYLDDDAEALARVIRSEVGTMSGQHQLHVAWVTRNLATQRRQTISRMACTPCGEQGGSRPVSSRQDATDEGRALARLVLAAPALLDPTGGATNFINPVLQDQLSRTGALPGYLGNTYAVVHRRWSSGGLAPYYRLGPTLEFWGPARQAAKAKRGKRR